jgi:hypothetical protein
MNRQEKLFWLYKSAASPPLPLWKIDQNIGTFLLINLFQNFCRLTRIPLPHYLFDTRTRLLENELNGIFVIKDVYNNLLSRPIEYSMYGLEINLCFHKCCVLRTDSTS